MINKNENDVKCVVCSHINKDSGFSNIYWSTSNYRNMEEAKFKTFNIKEKNYDFLLCDTEIGGVVGTSLLIFKHTKMGDFIDIDSSDYKNIESYFSNGSTLKSFISKYDFLPYSSINQKSYNVNIREVLEKVVEVKANNYFDAINKVSEMYSNGEIVLTADDFVDENIDIFNDEPKFYKFAKEVDFETLRDGKEAKVLVPSFTGEMEWEISPVVYSSYLEENYFKLYCDDIVLTNSIDLIIEKESPYGFRQDDITMNWYVFNYDTGEREKIDGIEVCFKNKFEAKDWCMNKITKGDYKISQEYLSKNKGKTR